ncbi:MAG: ribonuclease P protein component [Chloroflexi bacterium]|nr:ribonuclease P protein component [Chloroflexota bacterium]
MKKEWRLTKRADFEAVRRSGKCWTHSLIVLCTASSSQETTRVGFIVSKRIGNAVMRNRVKRLLREAVRLRYHNMKGGWNIVVIARSRIAGKTLNEVDTAVGSLLNAAKVLERHGENSD